MKKLLLLIIVLTFGFLGCSSDNMYIAPLEETRYTDDLSSFEQLPSDPDTLVGTCSMCSGH